MSLSLTLGPIPTQTHNPITSAYVDKEPRKGSIPIPEQLCSFFTDELFI